MRLAWLSVLVTGCCLGPPTALPMAEDLVGTAPPDHATCAAPVPPVAGPAPETLVDCSRTIQVIT